MNLWTSIYDADIDYGPSLQIENRSKGARDPENGMVWKKQLKLDTTKQKLQHKSSINIQKRTPYKTFSNINDDFWTFPMREMIDLFCWRSTTAIFSSSSTTWSSSWPKWIWITGTQIYVMAGKQIHH